MQYQTFAEIMEQRYEKTPEKVVFNFLSDHIDIKLQLTHQQLQNDINQLSVRLLEHTKLNDRCIIFCHPGKHFVTSFFTCLYNGLIAVPVNVSHHLGIEKIIHVINDCKPAIILTDSASVLSNALDAYPILSGVPIIDVSIENNISNDFFPPVKTKADSIAFLQYTSGSTSQPKGVKITHKNLLANLEIIKNKFQHHNNSVGVIWLPPFHDMGLIGGILQPYYVNFPVYLMSPLILLQRPLRWLQAITRYAATTSGGPNFAYQHCCNRIADEDLSTLNLQSWDVAFCGAEPINSNTLIEFSHKFSTCGFKANSFYSCYGLAEATLIVSGAQKNRPLNLHDLNGKNAVSCGYPGATTTIKIIHPETLNPCKEDEIGEIWVAGDSIAQGYWEKAVETEETFHSRLQDDTTNYLRTGDLGYLHQNELYVTGRYKELIIIDGKNHYPQDIELSIQKNEARFCYGGGAAISVTRNDREILVIFQEIAHHVHADTFPELIQHIRQKVAQYHDLSVSVIILLLHGKLPKTSSGKIRRKYCQELFMKKEVDLLHPVFIYPESTMVT